MSEKRRKLIKWIFWRIPIALMIIAGILILALKVVERYPEPLRQGFEEYLSKATGRNATIGTLEDVKFFPNFIVHAKNITVHNRQNAAMIDLEIEEFKMNSPFSSVFFNSKKMNEFSIKNLHAKKDMFADKAVKISMAGIVTKEEPDKVGSFFIADGIYGADNAHFEMKMGVGKYNYFILPTIPFSIEISDYEVSGNLKRNLLNIVSENTVFIQGDKRSDSKDYVLTDQENFLEDNPISCLLRSDDLTVCEKYLPSKI